MTFDVLLEGMAQVPSNLACRRGKVGATQLRRIAQRIRFADGRLLTLWGTDDRDRDGLFRIFAAFLQPSGIAILEYEMDAANPTYPSLAEFFPSAQRMERATFDLHGIRSTEPDTRSWLRHGGWPEAAFPLRRDFDANQQFEVESAPYAFVQVEGEGVHEIPVGPVHAGTIEPGHFRFSVVGEKVLKLEQRLGYKHKGIAKRFEALHQKEAHKLAARISGDSTVAYSWAYCAVLESITRVAIPERATHLRALALEHERIANHLGDLGALGNDAGFAFGLTHFLRMKEDLLRTNQTVFGARYLMDFVRPGGVASDVNEDACAQLLGQYATLEKDVASLRDIYENHAGVQDRFREAGILSKEKAREFDASGLAARASGIANDLRVNHPWEPYSRMELKMAVGVHGDVAARVAVRFDEIFESMRICRAILSKLAEGPISGEVPDAEPYRLGMGAIEAWRGPVVIALETGPQGGIRRCHFHDPSWQNWPLLEHAILGNIVPDFPLINKSFNLSYSGQDG